MDALQRLEDNFGRLFGLLWELLIFAKAGNDKAFRTAFMFYLVK